MKLDELVEDVMNLDINKESMDDNRSHSRISLLFAPIFSILILSVWRVCGFFFFIAHRPKLKNKDLGPDVLCFKGLGLVHCS